MTPDECENYKTILICDDNVLNRKLILAFLRGSPYLIIECENGRDCIKTAIGTQNRIDLVLLDIGLKDINGAEVCQAIRAGLNDQQRSLPIIAYTAHAMDEECNSYLNKGFNDVLIKPITCDDLFKILIKHI